MSAPKGASFNEGVPDSLLREWRVVQTTASNFSDILAGAGRCCIMAKSDMVAAYKSKSFPNMLPILIVSTFSSPCLPEAEETSVLQVLGGLVPRPETHLWGQSCLHVL